MKAALETMATMKKRDANIWVTLRRNRDSEENKRSPKGFTVTNRSIISRESSGWNVSRSVNTCHGTLGKVRTERKATDRNRSPFFVRSKDAFASLEKIRFVYSSYCQSVAGSSFASIFSPNILSSMLLASLAFLNPSRIFCLASSGFSLMNSFGKSFFFKYLATS